MLIKLVIDFISQNVMSNVKVPCECTVNYVKLAPCFRDFSIVLVLSEIAYLSVHEL